MGAVLQEKSFVPLERGSPVVHCGSIDDVSLADKHKFPLSYFPEGKWSRKGYLRSRWRIGGGSTVFDLVNIHLFHDASNLKSVEKTPSIYVDFRQRALQYTLDRVRNVTGAEVPHLLWPFIFSFFFKYRKTT